MPAVLPAAVTRPDLGRTCAQYSGDEPFVNPRASRLNRELDEAQFLSGKLPYAKLSRTIPKNYFGIIKALPSPGIDRTRPF